MKCHDHIYIHTPFCDGKCRYCSFYSIPYSPEIADRWIKAVLSEIQLRLGGLRPSPETIYIGGGTPSVLSAPQFERLANGIHKLMSFSRLKEWTVELNPGTLSSELAKTLRSSGVTRVSLGAQSFDSETLSFLGRRHTVDQIRRSADIVIKCGFSNFGLDLISGIPGMERKVWIETLEQAAKLNPTHVSVYSLTIEKGSQMADLVMRGSVVPKDDEQHLESMELAWAVLSGFGYRRYEISNAALPGMESLHNLAYWNGEDFLGFGPSSSSRAGLERRSNLPDLNVYLNAIESGGDAPAETEKLSLRSDLTERLMFAFRKTEGVDIDSFLRDFGPVPSDLLSAWKERLERLESDGFLKHLSARWVATEKGLNCADMIAAELIDETDFSD